MVHCNTCKVHLKGTWEIKAKNDIVELGIGSVYLIARVGGAAAVYCKRCYDQTMWRIYESLNLQLKAPQSPLAHIPAEELKTLKERLVAL
jgi:hypothetical protein